MLEVPWLTALACSRCRGCFGTKRTKSNYFSTQEFESYKVNYVDNLNIKIEANLILLFFFLDLEYFEVVCNIIK